jgi:hypothetical protein
MLVAGERVRETLAEIGAGFARIRDQIEFVDELEIGDAGGSADRMRRIGPAMAERAELVRSLDQHLPHLVGDDDARQRRIGRGEAFGDGDEVRLHAVMVGAEHRAEAAETGDDFVGDQQDVVFVRVRPESSASSRREAARCRRCRGSARR